MRCSLCPRLLIPMLSSLPASNPIKTFPSMLLSLRERERERERVTQSHMFQILEQFNERIGDCRHRSKATRHIQKRSSYRKHSTYVSAFEPNLFFIPCKNFRTSSSLHSWTGLWDSVSSAIVTSPASPPRSLVGTSKCRKQNFERRLWRALQNVAACGWFASIVASAHKISKPARIRCIFLTSEGYLLRLRKTLLDFL